MDTAAGGRRPFQGCEDLPMGGAQVVVEAAADRGEADAAAGALEQRRAHPALQLLDGLADPAGGDTQAFGRAAEVQLFGERQERLQFVPFQHRPGPHR